MTSTFRLIGAEFKKIFKRPSVYIMALFIVITIFLSLYIFDPVEGNNYTIDYGENLTSQDYYDIFIKQDLSNSEKGINESFANTDKIYSYYLLSYNRDNNLKDYHEEVIETIENMRNSTDAAVRNNLYTSLKTKLANFSNAFKDYSSLVDYPHISYTTSNSDYLNNYSSKINTLLEWTKVYDSYEIIEYYDNNDCKNGLYNDLNNAINYIAPTLYTMAENIKDSYNSFNYYYEDGSRYLIEIEKQKDLMLDYTNNFKNYFDILTENDYPIILINSDTKNEISSNLDFAIEALNSFHNLGETATLPEYTNLKEKLDTINFVNYFTTTFMLENSPIYEVKLENSHLKLLEKAKAKVETNKTTIKEEINNLKQDETIKNIQFKITEYYLLSETYKSFMNDSVILALSEKYASHEFEEMHGYDLKEFSIYEYNERVTANKYYIDHNIYSNSYATNFTFNQNSTLNTTNAYDFMYFTMELCSVIIVVFAMLLISSLIAGESDSGTIKLLLVRPYKRSKIVTAKLFATIFFVITFMLFSAILSFTGGYFVYGLSDTNILAIFNASTAFEISPILLMVINVSCLLLEAIFYILIALMISTLCKNYAGSIYICLLFLIVSYTLNILFGNAFWYSFFPGMNLHLFKYFGNSFTSVATSSVLQNVLITPIQSSMNFLYSALLSGAYSLIAIAVSYSVFNKRDF